MPGSHAPRREQPCLTPVHATRPVEGLQVRGFASAHANWSHHAILPASAAPCLSFSTYNVASSITARVRSEFVCCCCWNSCPRYSATHHTATTPPQPTPNHLGVHHRNKGTESPDRLNQMPFSPNKTLSPFLASPWVEAYLQHIRSRLLESEARFYRNRSSCR